MTEAVQSFEAIPVWERGYAARNLRPENGQVFGQKANQKLGRFLATIFVLVINESKVVCLAHFAAAVLRPRIAIDIID